MCHLEIELEEVDDVVFSVIGQSSIHLSGYYVRASSRSNAGDDESYPSQSIMPLLFNISDCEIILNIVIRESYGEDIGQSDTDEEHDANEDSYESDFIDDRDVIAVSDDECSSPRRCKQGKRSTHVTIDSIAKSHLYILAFILFQISSYFGFHHVKYNLAGKS